MSSFSDGFMYSLGSASAWALVALVAFSIALGIGWRIVRRLTAPIRMVGDAASTGVRMVGDVASTGVRLVGNAASTGVEYLSQWRKWFSGTPLLSVVVGVARWAVAAPTSA